jgi:RNA polymerase subunit RPABC4/transcription elongation factor Spt4
MEFLGTRWTYETCRQLLHAAFESATSAHLEQYLDDINIGVGAIRDFAVATGLGTSAWSQPREHREILGISHWERRKQPKNTGDLRVGYSDDLMCAPLMLGRLAHPLTESSGITFVRQPRREVERVAALSDALRASVVQARELISADPALATMKMARLVELNLRKVAEHALGSKSPKQISAVIESLEERGILPPLVASSALWIQSVCNVAAHQEDLSEATASAAMTHLLDILEWLEESQVTTEKRCPSCGGLLESAWVVCPHCTWQFQQTCEHCDLAIDASWKACPGCGSSTTKQEGYARG